MCALFASKGGQRSPAMATADHADAYKQLPLSEKGELAAVVALKNPPDCSWYGIVFKT